MTFREENPIAAAFEKHAAENGRQEAIVTAERSFTYAQLSQRAAKLADRLRSRGGAADEPTFALLEDDIDRCIVLLGAHFAGKVYIPLDSRNPTARTAQMLQTARTGSLVFDRQNAAVAKKLVGTDQSLLDVEDIEGSVPPFATTPVYDPQALAWILFTSGSTGRPKGVMQTHRNSTFHTGQTIRSFRLQTGVRFAVASPLTSLGGVVATLAVMSSGGTLHLMQPGKRPAHALLAWIAARDITTLLIAPTLFRRMVASPGAREQLSSLRLLRLSGETVTVGEFDLFNRLCHADCVLSVGYAATETGIISEAFSKHPASVNGGQVTVGIPQQSVEVHLADESGQPVTMGQPGEIVVTSDYLSPGYWNMPELTDLAFSFAPDGSRRYRTGDLGILHEDGSLEHVGRLDSQIQIFGQRVEIAEIEKALRSIPAVEEAAIHKSLSASREWRLEAFVIMDKSSEHGSTEVRGELRELLPPFMQPHAITILDRLPLAGNGKIDRLALAELAELRELGARCELGETGPVPGGQDTLHVEPRDETERLLARIWSDVLGVDRVGMNSDFLELGGDSLGAVQVINRIRKVFLIEISIREILSSCTIVDLARVVDTRRSGADPSHEEGIEDGSL